MVIVDVKGGNDISEFMF